MGLDITAASKTVFVESISDCDDFELRFDYDTYELLWRNDQFPGREEGLIFEGSRWSVYQIQGESRSFYAGSYSGYNWWRKQLCLMVNDREPRTANNLG